LAGSYAKQYAEGARLDDHGVPFFSTPARFHPCVTIAYFLISMAWNAALGIRYGVYKSANPAKARLCAFLFGPLAEILVLLGFFWGEYFVYLFFIWWWGQWLMLLFYSTAGGLLWMGLKWNLLIAISRSKLPTN
jgi:hypothetical protein